MGVTETSDGNIIHLGSDARHDYEQNIVGDLEAHYPILREVWI